MSLVPLIGVVALTSGCGPSGRDDEDDGPTGSIGANLVSPITGCGKLNVDSDVRDLSKTFGIEAGVETSVQIDRVPLTDVLVGGELYSTPDCSGSPLFVAKAVPAHLSPENPTAHVSLVYEGNGTLFVDGEIEGSCSERVPVVSPPPSSQHGMTYFASRRETLLLTNDGGSMALYAFDFESQSWSHIEIEPAAAPPGRVDPAFTYDQSSHKAVMFGGDDGAPRADLWEFDGCKWQNRTPPTPGADWPSPRWGASSAFDPASDSVAIFGGIEISLSTWTWEADPADLSVFEWSSETGSFTKHQGAGAVPSDRGLAPAATDTNRGVIYMASGLGAYTADTAWYQWDGSTKEWSIVALESEVAPRASGSMFFDPELDRAILTGGQWYGLTTPVPGFSAIDPSSGSVTHLSGEAYNRFWAPIAFDSDRNVGIQYGGYIAEVGSWVGPLSDTRIFSGDGSIVTLAGE